MTTSLVDQHWRDRHHPQAIAPTQLSERTPVGAVRIAQLQGVVMAVYGVSASAALGELQWRSAQRNTSVADLAEQAMASVSGRRGRTALGIFSAGMGPLRSRGTTRR